MNTLVPEEAKERILNAAIELFSRKGFDATRVNEIAESAGVNKALIYYCFKSKLDILDTLLEKAAAKLSAASVEFVNTYIIPLIKSGKLDIVGDRFHFSDEGAMRHFQASLAKYYERLVDYLLTNRALARILMFESLKGGKHENSLFRLLELMDKNPGNPVYRTLQSTDEDFDYDEEPVFFQFFFSWIPLISIAAYYDEYKAKSRLSDERMKELTLRSLENLTRAAEAQHFVIPAVQGS